MIIKKTQTINGEITVKENGEDILVKTMSQYIDERGRRCGSIGEQMLNEELYYSNLEQVRADEDAFLAKVREIEDSFLTRAEEALVN